MSNRLDTDLTPHLQVSLRRVRAALVHDFLVKFPGKAVAGPHVAQVLVYCPVGAHGGIKEAVF